MVGVVRTLSIGMGFGLLATLLVAWSLASIWPPADSMRVRPLSLAVEPGLAALVRRACEQVPREIVAGARIREQGNRYSRYVQVRVDLTREETNISWAGAEFIEAGLPFRAFRCERFSVFSKQSSQLNVQLADELWRGGIALDVSQVHIVLPWWPKWSGLLGNTVVYTGLVLSVRGLAIKARRVVRTRSDRCGKCGYPLKGLGRGHGVVVCPECGQPHDK